MLLKCRQIVNQANCRYYRDYSAIKYELDSLWIKRLCKQF